VRSLAGHTRSDLLHGPFGCRMFRDVPVHDTACADIEDDEDVDEAEGRGDHDEEIADKHFVRVITYGTWSTSATNHAETETVAACSA
jgi:hypothetical protein